MCNAWTGGLRGLFFRHILGGSLGGTRGGLGFTERVEYSYSEYILLTEAGRTSGLGCLKRRAAIRKLLRRSSTYLLCSGPGTARISAVALFFKIAKAMVTEPDSSSIQLKLGLGEILYIR